MRLLALSSPLRAHARGGGEGGQPRLKKVGARCVAQPEQAAAAVIGRHGSAAALAAVEAARPQQLGLPYPPSSAVSVGDGSGWGLFCVSE